MSCGKRHEEQGRMPGEHPCTLLKLTQILHLGASLDAYAGWRGDGPEQERSRQQGQALEPVVPGGASRPHRVGRVSGGKSAVCDLWQLQWKGPYSGP